MLQTRFPLDPPSCRCMSVAPHNQGGNRMEIAAPRIRKRDLQLGQINLDVRLGRAEKDLKKLEHVPAALSAALQDLRDFRHQTTARFDVIDTRLDGIDTRLDGVDTRLDGIDTRLGGI